MDTECAWYVPDARADELQACLSFFCALEDDVRDARDRHPATTREEYPVQLVGDFELVLRHEPLCSCALLVQLHLSRIMRQRTTAREKEEGVMVFQYLQGC
jgi:hypothetical protein